MSEPLQGIADIIWIFIIAGYIAEKKSHIEGGRIVSSSD